jgi:hypothetical protein
VPSTALERVFEIDWPVMFVQKIGKSFIGNLLKTHHPIARQHGERLPGRVIELDALAYHASPAYAAVAAVALSACGDGLRLAAAVLGE